MHPLLDRKSWFGFYLIAWIPLTAILVVVLVFRGDLTWEPSDAFDLRLIYQLEDVEENGSARVLGNVIEDGFEAVWNGKPMQKLRKQMFDGDLPKVCQGCAVLEAPKWFS